MRLIDADALKEKLLRERDVIPKTVGERYGLGVERPYNHGNSMRGGIRKALRCMEKHPQSTPQTLCRRGGGCDRTITSVVPSADKAYRCCAFRGLSTAPTAEQI